MEVRAVDRAVVSMCGRRRSRGLSLRGSIARSFASASAKARVRARRREARRGPRGRSSRVSCVVCRERRARIWQEPLASRSASGVSRRCRDWRTRCENASDHAEGGAQPDTRTITRTTGTATPRVAVCVRSLRLLRSRCCCDVLRLASRRRSSRAMETHERDTELMLRLDQSTRFSARMEMAWWSLYSVCRTAKCDRSVECIPSAIAEPSGFNRVQTSITAYSRYTAYKIKRHLHRAEPGFQKMPCTWKLYVADPKSLKVIDQLAPPYNFQVESKQTGQHVWPENLARKFDSCGAHHFPVTKSPEL